MELMPSEIMRGLVTVAVNQTVGLLPSISMLMSGLHNSESRLCGNRVDEVYNSRPPLITTCSLTRQLKEPLDKKRKCPELSRE